MRVWDYAKRFFAHYFVPGPHNAHRPRVLHRSWLVFFLAVILATEGFLVSNLIARQSNQQFLAAVVPAEIIALTNTERADNNVGNVTEDALLDSAASAKATNMAANGYFSHVGPDGKTPWQWIDESGYQYQYAGENLAVRFINSSDVVNAWMASPTHRANMVKPVYTQIGVGVAVGMYEGQPATYVVQYFGTPLAAEVAAGEAKSAAAAAVAAIPPRAAAVSSPSLASSSPQPARVAAAAAPKVEGASTAAPQTQTIAPAQASVQTGSFTQSLVKQLIRLFSEPQQSSNLVLGFIAALLLIAIGITFFTHLQVQHGGMLAAGAFVVSLALFFFAANASLVGSLPLPGGAQAAAVAAAQGGVIISTEAADTGYALFPQ